MLIHAKLERSLVNGPGRRAVIWVQGCQGMNCKNCWNPDTHEFDLRREGSVDSLIDWVLSLEDIEGVTFSGGEPVQQIQDLIDLCRGVRSVRPGLSFGMFTGYGEAELEQGQFTFRGDTFLSVREDRRRKRYLWRQLREMLDFAVVGRYVDRLRTESKPLCGSSNQKVLWFTDRYSEDDLALNEVEVHVDSQGLIQITGFPPEGGLCKEVCA